MISSLEMYESAKSTESQKSYREKIKKFEILVDIVTLAVRLLPESHLTMLSDTISLL